MRKMWNLRTTEMWWSLLQLQMQRALFPRCPWSDLWGLRSLHDLIPFPGSPCFWPSITPGHLFLSPTVHFFIFLVSISDTAFFSHALCFQFVFKANMVQDMNSSLHRIPLKQLFPMQIWRMLRDTAARGGCYDRFLGWQTLAFVIKAAVCVWTLEYCCVVTGAKGFNEHEFF